MTASLLLEPTGVRLVRPSVVGGGAVALDADQRRVVDRVCAPDLRALLALGAPGTGKTTTAIEAVVAATDALGLTPDDVLVLVPTRRAAADLRDRLSARLSRTAGQPMVRTAASAAFSVLRARAAHLGEPPPTLISGPEQDLLLGELLAGHAAGDGVPLSWPAAVPADVIGVRSFRDELRDLLMRAAERGLAPDDLALLGRRHGRAEWVAAAQLYGEYLDVTRLRQSTPDAGDRFDPAVVVDEAAEALLAWDDEVPGAARPRWRLVVVDDHQESTAATARLLRVLADDGARLLLLADPDEAVQTFRGAFPALVGRATAAGRGLGELGAESLLLGTAWRQPAALRAVTTAVTQGIGSVAGVRHRRAVGRPDGATTGATARVAILPSPAQEAAYVVHALRSAHLERGVPWGRMAVVARSGGQVTALRRALAGGSVPVSVLGSDVPLREEPAVRPLLLALRCALDPVTLDAEAATTLLTSPYGGADAVGLRRVRRALRAEELAGGGGRASDALLVEMLQDPARTATLPSTVRRGPRRLAELLAAGRLAGLEPGATAQTVLWAVWSAAGLAEPWRRAALAGGAAGARADRDLDAVLALFRAAETFVDRLPQAAPLAFVEYLESQDLPSDSLAARSADADTVAVLTPAGAAGREWDVVVVAGVQDGTWPDLRLRDSLLGAQALVELLAGRSADGEVAGGEARAAVLADELRSFAVATSRARRALLVTAVADADQQPSPFVDLVQPPDGSGEAGDGSDERDERLATAPAPLDLRGLVGVLRARLEESVARPGGRPDPQAVQLLAHLARRGVEGADPAQWHGLAPLTTTEPLWPENEKVPVSPSKAETVTTCALRWALETAGGTVADGTSQTLGTLIHAIAQTLPRGTESELLAELDRRWLELGLRPGWPSLAERRRAEAMVRRLAAYVASAGEPVLLEAPFSVELDRAVLRGVVDRVEDVGDGLVQVVDLKTGKRAPTAGRAEDNPQLASYQLAVTEGAFDGLPAGSRSAGAQLVFVALGSRPTVRRQAGLEVTEDGSTWAHAMVDGVATTMAASAFTACVNDLCTMCPVRTSCPVRPEGRQVVE
ncbi:ATP-dependent helicase [Cellulomonas aerilata]|uniref:ATP-dependent helicase n=1 Tax=Cellulomonas aerilata TaxID=515326 RepID=UPI001FE96737|nr:ATP-dependent DNA helicase [Cellulomonas aerilata]